MRVPNTKGQSEFFAVGIDPSVVSTAITISRCRVSGGSFDGFAEDSTYLLNDCPVGPERSAARLLWIQERVAGILERTKGLPTAVCIEGYSFGSKSKAQTMAEVGGVLRLEIVRSGAVCLFTVAPSSWKKFMVGDGHAEKVDIINHLNGAYGTKFGPRENDKADSFAIARLCTWLALPVLGFGRKVAVPHQCERLSVNFC